MVKTLFSATSSPPPPSPSLLLLCTVLLLFFFIFFSVLPRHLQRGIKKEEERAQREGTSIPVHQRRSIANNSAVPGPDLRQVFNVSGCSSIPPRCFCTSDAQQRMSLPREITSTTRFSYRATLFSFCSFFLFLPDVIGTQQFPLSASLGIS